MQHLLYALVAIFTFVFGFAPTALAADRVALVIGNGAYANASVLPNPANDARAVAGALRDIGFDVIEGQDLDRARMERSLRDFLRKSQGAKVALFFYAGHGMEVGGQNYLVPVDAALETASDLSFETIGMNKILDNLNDPNRANIVMLDACRDNPLARSFRSRVGATRSVGNGLAAYSSVGTGTLIALATAPGQVALDGEGVNSPFTTSLLQHIKTPGLEIRQMLTRVRRDVLDKTGNQQQPWDNSSLLGDVFLAGKTPGQQQTAALNTQPADNSSSLALQEAERLRKQAAEELERARQVAAELEAARKRAEEAAAEAERQRSAALVPRNDPAKKPEPETNNPRDRFAAIALSKSSLSWGSGFNYNTKNAAEQRALAECTKHAKDCEIVTWVRNACVALSTGKGGYGHSWNESKKTAESEAVRYCRKYGRNCKVTYSVCSLPQ